jgi:guanylate kinase
MPPDRKVLEARLRKRSLDAEEVIQRRLVTASREIENYEKYDYILVNDRLDESIQALTAILLAERLKRSGVRGSVDDAKMLAEAEGCRLSNIRKRLQPILTSFATAATSGGR